LTETGYKISPPLLADYYLERHTVIIVTDSGEPRLYEYDNGAYKYRSHLEVKAALGAYITAFRRSLWQSGKVFEAYTAIIQTSRLYATQKELNANPDIVCLNNGLLNLKTWTLNPHNPHEYYTTQLDCDFTETIPDTPVFDHAINVYCGVNEEKKRFLLENKIALWDVLHSCEICGAEDGSIKNPVANDFSEILAGSEIKNIFTTGKTAKKLYDKYCFEKTQIVSIYLPSTSSANRKYYNFDILCEEYKIIKNVLT
jgi:hypothetical protein